MIKYFLGFDSKVCDLLRSDLLIKNCFFWDLFFKQNPACVRHKLFRSCKVGLDKRVRTNKSKSLLASLGVLVYLRKYLGQDWFFVDRNVYVNPIFKISSEKSFKLIFCLYRLKRFSKISIFREILFNPTFNNYYVLFRIIRDTSISLLTGLVPEFRGLAVGSLVKFEIENLDFFTTYLIFTLIFDNITFNKIQTCY